MDVLARRIMHTKLKKMGFKGKPHSMVLIKGQVSFQARLNHYDKVVIVVRGMNDTRLHTSSPGLAQWFVDNVTKFPRGVKGPKSFGLS